MKHFVTLFHLGLKNFHLKKDVGYIPYYLNKIFGYKCSILTPYIDGEKYYEDGLSVESLKGKNVFLHKSLIIHTGILYYLFKNSKKIDILNVYHFNVTSFFYGYIYKLLNRKGVLYWKLDYNNNIFKENKHFYVYNKHTNYLNKTLENQFIKISDIISIETIEGLGLLSEYNKKFKGKLFFLPNGIDDLNIKLKIKKPKEKFNQIISVGRIGTYQKNTEMFLSILSKISDDIKKYKWTVKFVGPYEDKFFEKIDNFFKDNPTLKDYVKFLGPLDKDKVYDLYNESKIFCLTSRFEGFANVLPEALYFGNMIVTTDISGAKDITNDCNHGFIVKQGDEEGYVKTLKDIFTGKINYENYYEKAIKYSNLYRWSTIIKDLHKKIS